MKVYDGAGLIADKSGAMVVPVRIDGLEQTPFSRLSRDQVRRRWFPKVTVTILEPVKLDGRSGAEGQAAPAGRRRGALRDHVGPDVPHHLDRPHRLRRRWSRPRERHGRRRVAVEDPVTGTLTYKRLLIGAAILGRKLMPLARRGRGASA